MGGDWRTAFLAAVLLVLGSTSTSLGQDPQGMGVTAAGQGLACSASARVNLCLAHHRDACRLGYALACKLADLGANCFGGDPEKCRYYQQLLAANRACVHEGNQSACDYLKRQDL